ncbi:hypothetical protein [Flavobacterium sp.]|uniref:hypothetical protein n=1 Tax=Flavobacterium sp. TaxID=239 RepID=UPI0022BCF8DA|nr:hypothetical protein [Flavobacterium sp.]MCZ8145678.1 hypothetical protein [Flavobacterium sp.]MCZ8366122.1 hypothetical protein [Flavobacterium sp.]
MKKKEYKQPFEATPWFFELLSVRRYEDFLLFLYTGIGRWLLVVGCRLSDSRLNKGG